MNQDYHSSLFAETPPPPPSPLGAKPLDLRARIAEAHRLSGLMAELRPFCFLRMGDMDLSYLLAIQDGRLADVHFAEGAVSGTLPCGNPGLGARHANRFRRAFAQGNYVDFHERLYPMEHWLPRLRLPRPGDLHRNPDRETSYLSLTWMEFEFKSYCQGRRVGIAGAESRLLELLSAEPAWRVAAGPYWPDSGSVFFHQVRDDGRNLDANLDLIKEDLRAFIEQNRLDTLFLSLGGGAKVLCYELSGECDICAFDFGAMLRALTYSACDGNRAARATHSPFLFRVPFEVFMPALERAFPNLAAEELLAKTHAQLLLDVQFKEPGWTHTAFEYDFSEENRARFRAAYRTYTTRYRRLGRASAVAESERRGFLHFCGTHGLTLEGRAFYAKFMLKSAIRRAICKSVAGRDVSEV